MEPTPILRRRGRPRGTHNKPLFVASRSFRFTRSDLEALALVAATRQETESDALRRLIREAAVRIRKQP